MSGHTPAPWLVDGADIKGCDGFYLAFVADDCGLSVMTANARLIAAAPALLAAAKAALGWIIDDRQFPETILQQIKAAIALAEATRK